MTGSHSYGTSSFTTSVAATYSFTATATTLADGDPFLAIYKGTFNPANPTANLVGCNDDTHGLLPEFSAALDANTTYVMVATSYYNGSYAGTVTFSTGVTPTLAMANLSAMIGESGKSMVATSNASGTITYSINNPARATIDPNTGALTLLSAGTAIVTATQAPEASPGLYNGGSVTATLTVTANAAPVASNVAISGTPQAGQKLTGSYTYSDADADPEGASTFQWIRAATAIAGANGTQYTPVAADVGQTLTFCVTPVASTGTATGAQACSTATVHVSAAPQAIPTLSEWGLALLSLLTAALGLRVARRRV